MDLETPRAPFDQWPVQRSVPGLGTIWYTQPATFVNHRVETPRETAWLP